jgi:Iap family predicted aminopeptidase
MFGKKTCLRIALGLLLICPAVAVSQSVTYTRVPRSTIENRLHQFQGKDSERGATLKKLFSEAGCNDAHLSDQPVRGAYPPNVICTLPGSGNGLIVIGAHFDYVHSGDGVVDNWSSASLLPSLFESLKGAAHQYTFVFIGFSAEEAGLIGSSHYVNQLSKEQIDSIRAMVDMDTLGLGPTEIWASNSDPDLVQLMARVANGMKLPVSVMNVDGVGTSDGQPFKARKVPIITLHSVTAATLGILHTPDDKFAAIKLSDYYDSYNLIAAYLSMLDSRPNK